MRLVKKLSGRSVVLILVVLAALSISLQMAATGRDDGPGVYIVDPADLICGLSDPRQLTNPAKVEYERLMEATPAMRELRRERIDPESARGVILRTKAQAEVKRASQVVSKRLGHCSVWKEIRRRDGKTVHELTQQVRKEIGRTDETLPPAISARSTR